MYAMKWDDAGFSVCAWNDVLNSSGSHKLNFTDLQGPSIVLPFLVILPVVNPARLCGVCHRPLWNQQHVIL